MYKTTILLAALAYASGGFIPQALAGDHDDHHDEASEEGAKEVWACPMHPDVTSDKEGECSKCGMTLVKQEAHDHSSHDHGDADHEVDEADDHDHEADEGAGDHDDKADESAGEHGH